VVLLGALLRGWRVGEERLVGGPLVGGRFAVAAEGEGERREKAAEGGFRRRGGEGRLDAW
jgi:hypothetical protein